MNKAPHRAAPSLQYRLEALQRECERHGFAEQAERAAQRMRDLGEPLLIMVVGEGNFGKSSLINALVGQEVADVHVLPKTWKVDLYEASCNGDEAWLYLRQSPAKPKIVSLAEAKQFCEREENQAKEMKEQGQSWKSDLFQVKWRRNSQWPQQGAVLVDTPGFSQLRADTSVSDLKLYGSKGIEMAAADAFEYYYYRADIVLWCINGSKVQDQDTLEALSKVHTLDKTIIGVLTKMDRIPAERWEEIKGEAQRVFGRYIKEFVCTAAGAKDAALKGSTTDSLRECLASRYLGNAGTAKEGAVTSYVEGECDAFLRSVDGIMQCYINNVKKRSDVLTSTLKKMQGIHDAVQQEISSVWSSTHKKAVSSLDALYDRADGDVERFRHLVSQTCIDQGDIDRSINRILGNAQQRLQAEGQLTTAQLDWNSVRIEARSTSSFKSDSRQALTAALTFRSEGELKLNLTGGEGMGTGIAVGGAAAAAGAFLLGPIGIAAGVVGWIAGKMMKRSNCVGEATSQINKFCESNSERIQGRFTEAAQKYHTQLTELIEKSFSRHHGKAVNGVVDHTCSADHSLNVLGMWPKDRKTSLWPRAFLEKNQNEYDSTSCYYFAISAIDPAYGKLWDDAVLREWKETLTPQLRTALFDPDSGAFSEKSLNQLKEQQHLNVKKQIIATIKQLDWESAAKGVKIDLGDMVVDSSVPGKLREKLPGFHQVLKGADTSRISRLKAHSISDLTGHFSGRYQHRMESVIGDAPSVLKRKKYELKRYIKTILLSGLTLFITLAVQPWNIILMWYRGELSFQVIEGDLKVPFIVVVSAMVFLFATVAMASSYRKLHAQAGEDAANALGGYVSEVRKRMKALIDAGLEA